MKMMKMIMMTTIEMTMMVIEMMMIMIMTSIEMIMMMIEMMIEMMMIEMIMMMIMPYLFDVVVCCSQIQLKIPHVKLCFLFGL